MSLLQTFLPKFSHHFPSIKNPNSDLKLPLSSPKLNPNLSFIAKFSASASSSSQGPPEADPNINPKPQKGSGRRRKSEENDPIKPTSDAFPSTIPRKPRRGRRSEAAAVEDFVRESLEKTFASIRRQDAEVLDGKDEILKEKLEEDEEEVGGDEEKAKSHLVEEEDPDWPLDADIGWGIRASEYFDEHSIKNVVVDGVEIDWEGEMEEGWVKEINCLEWESFAFHPSPLIVLVFERYNRAADNWKLLKELEKATKVFWNAKDRLPPRTVKIDINIETDLAYALKVNKCPQLLFLKGNKILYREKELRTSDELVHMIAHFYYNANRPSWVDAAAVAPPF